MSRRRRKSGSGFRILQLLCMFRPAPACALADSDMEAVMTNVKAWWVIGAVLVVDWTFIVAKARS